MRPHSTIVTVPSGYDRRKTKDLLTLALMPPSAFLRTNQFGYSDIPYSSIWVVNYHFDSPKEARCVRLNGRPRTFKRRPEIRISWAYGYMRTSRAAYGYFISLDGDTWDPNEYAPYRLLSTLTAAEQRKLNRTRKEPK